MTKKHMYSAEYKITGRVRVILEASSMEEAERKARKHDVQPEDGDVEWEFDELVNVTRVRP